MIARGVYFAEPTPHVVVQMCYFEPSETGPSTLAGREGLKAEYGCATARQGVPGLAHQVDWGGSWPRTCDVAAGSRLIERTRTGRPAEQNDLGPGTERRGRRR